MTALRLYRPGSFRNLVLLGFAFVSLPLLIALVNASSFVDRLERQSTGALFRAVTATQGSRALLDHVVSLERKARQFNVLGDDPTREAYLEEAGHVRDTIRDLYHSALPEALKAQIRALADGIETVSEAVAEGTKGSERVRESVERFQSLNEVAKGIFADTNGLVVRESDSLQKTAGNARHMLAWQMVAVIPAALAFAILFILLISRPVRQIDRAIHRLGEGDFASQVSVQGPKDLEFLGKKLDWLRHRLLDLQEEKTRFLAQVSHDLKTPLTAIREGADLLREELVGPLNGQQREVAGILCQNSVQLQRSIQGLLDFSVAQAKSVFRGTRSQVSLRTLIDDILADHRPVAVKKELRIQVTGPELAVWGDEERLRVIVDNLLSNAMKFTPAGGRIAVSVGRTERRVVVEVTDSGPGIAPAERGRIFKAFYQGKSPEGGIIRGSGLGLSIAQEYALAHGGSIEAVDCAEGAHFRVTLPFGREKGDG